MKSATEVGNMLGARAAELERKLRESQVITRHMAHRSAPTGACARCVLFMFESHVRKVPLRWRLLDQAYTLSRSQTLKWKASALKPFARCTHRSVRAQKCVSGSEQTAPKPAPPYRLVAGAHARDGGQAT